VFSIRLNLDIDDGQPKDPILVIHNIYAILSKRESILSSKLRNSSRTLILSVTNAEELPKKIRIYVNPLLLSEHPKAY